MVILNIENPVLPIILHHPAGRFFRHPIDSKVIYDNSLNIIENQLQPEACSFLLFLNVSKTFPGTIAQVLILKPASERVLVFYALKICHIRAGQPVYLSFGRTSHQTQ